jgi:hypothetical protein
VSSLDFQNFSKNSETFIKIADKLQPPPPLTEEKIFENFSPRR